MMDETNTDASVDKYYGKYRGTVVNNFDPENRGRIQAIVPDVQGLIPITYALPCLPAAGKGSGAFIVPETGSSVWIEFEQGDPEYPIWTGCFWASTLELPEMGIASTSPAHNMAFQTTGRNSITLFGVPGAGITLCAGPLEDPDSPRILITSAGIVLSSGVSTQIMITPAGIVMNGALVDINKGALTILE